LLVFLCHITATDLVRLNARLEDIIEPKEDQILFIRLCGPCAVDIEALGVPTPANDAQDVVIVSRGGPYGLRCVLREGDR
jgi:CRISPR/Cas system-associated endoribonuclease Cas2